MIGLTVLGASDYVLCKSNSCAYLLAFGIGSLIIGLIDIGLNFGSGIPLMMVFQLFMALYGTVQILVPYPDPRMCPLIPSTVAFIVAIGSATIVKRWEEFPNATFTFDCTDRSIGFYADLEFDCQIFHLCDAAGRRIPYMCDKMTAFNQKFRVCDWAYNVDCETAPDWYYLNDLTYEAPPPKANY
eukprot:snap_masked-scaffold435_size171904-processed-gene-0.7 protein:Tk07240 transcript:snap_masked-scaffold435_size171904-processed-gene-0.7-mRNA-1 annotation:"hypothetical protein DAPPUDRAFT_106356"